MRADMTLPQEIHELFLKFGACKIVHLSNQVNEEILVNFTWMVDFFILNTRKNIQDDRIGIGGYLR